MEKNKLMMIVIIAILAIMLIAVGFGFVYTIRMIQTVQTPKEAEAVAVSQDYDANSTTMIPLSSSLKANLLPENDGVEHLALVSVQVALAGPVDATKKEKKKADAEIEELVASMEAREVIIRDLAIRLLRKSTYSELRRADGQEILAEEMVSELQSKFNSSYIVEVFFDEFFLQ